MAREHQEYIQTKVNPTLENLVTQVLLERPDNPVPFMVKWLAEQAPNAEAFKVVQGAQEAETLRKEIKDLQEEIRQLEQSLTTAAPAAAIGSSVGAGSAVTGSAQAEEEDEEAEEEEDDDVEDDVPLAPPPSYLKKGPRASVSAEAYGQWNTMKAFTPTVHPKTDEQRERLLSLLQQSFLFRFLDGKSLDVVVGAVLERPVAAAERVIHEGGDGNAMFVIETGAFDCIKLIAGEETVVKRCGPGDFFGELALLYNCPRAASVQATEDSVMWELDRDTFNHIVRDASMKKRETYTEFLKSVQLLDSLGAYERSQMADTLQQEAFDEGDLVIRQGDTGDKFFLVEEGELVALKAAEGEEAKEVKTYGRGDYFGELTLLRDEVRAASILAKTDGKLLSMDRKTFHRMLGSLEELLKQNAKEHA